MVQLLLPQKQAADLEARKAAAAKAIAVDKARALAILQATFDKLEHKEVSVAQVSRRIIV